jgi:ERF superfamily
MLVPQNHAEPLPKEAMSPQLAPAASAGNIGQLTKAISQVMLEIDAVAKRGQNTFHRYRYARMEDVLRRLTPLLGKNGIAIFQDEVSRSMFDEESIIAITYEFAVAHESGEIWPWRLRQTGASRCRDSKGGWDDKSVNKCHTAARKYFLLSLFQIPTADVAADADRTAAQDAPEKKREPEVKAWVTRFLAGMRQLPTIAALDQYIKAHEAALKRLLNVAADDRKLIAAAIERRRSELAVVSPKPLPPLVQHRPEEAAG